MVDEITEVSVSLLERNLNRAQVREIIARGLMETHDVFKKLLTLFHLKEKDYHRFMRFLHEQDLIPGGKKKKKQ